MINFSPVYEDGILIGEEFKTSSHLFFFGNRAGSLELVKSHYASYKFLSLLQVHGDIILERESSQANLDEPVGDGHFTFEKNLALLIKTADCLPVILVSNSHSAPIIALHAGWRGVVERIIPKAIELFPKERFTGYIGPHIQFENFEVGKDVATQISNSCPNATKISKSHIDPNKLYINLARVAELQMELNGSRCGYTSSIDTLTNLNYPSYRRDAKKERMWTFVAKI